MSFEENEKTLLRQRSSKPRTSLSLVPTLVNVRVTEMFESQSVWCSSFLVHVVQSVLQWGKDPIVVVKREEDSNYKATGRTNQ